MIDPKDKTPRMRVVLVDFVFFAYSIQLANALSEYCEVILILPDNIPDYLRQLLKETVVLRQFYLPRRRHLSSILMIGRILSMIRGLKPDAIHVLAYQPWMNLSMPLLSDIPIIATVHDAIPHPGEKATPFLSWQWRFADQIIVHADAIKLQMTECNHVNERIIHVVPHGALGNFLTWLDSDATEKNGSILFFGRIFKYKGLQYLIEAEPIISSCVPEAMITIAGDGESFEIYERMMVHKDRFIVHNQYIPDEMVARLFSETSVVVLPYVEASQSGVLAIAYAFGKPVIATNVGGIPEVLIHGKTGLLVEPRDHLGLAEAVISLLQDPEKRREMGRNALLMAQSELSWSSIAAQTYKVYQNALPVV
jgi:glycosyltransferase involved in cell wall biosynthesis